MLQELGKIIQDLIAHEINIITDSEWFADLVEEKVKQVMEEQKERTDDKEIQGRNRDPHLR
jgi:hypothetical protein